MLVLLLLWSLVEVHSQTEYPYVSFMGEILPNHSYVDLTLVGTSNSDPSNTVRCITDLSTCCSYNQGIHRGDWYFPNGSALQPPSSGDRTLSSQRIALRCRHDTMSLSGLYHCQLLLSMMILTSQ